MVFTEEEGFFSSHWADREIAVTKKEIIEIVSQRTRQKKSHTKTIVECVFDSFIETLARERRIEVRNFGVFRVKRTPARVGRSPVTKESADVPARNIVQFKAGKYMRDRVAKGAIAAEKLPRENG